MARNRTIPRESAPKPGQVGMVYGQVRRASIDLAVLKEDPIPFATLCGDWLTAAGLRLGAATPRFVDAQLDHARRRARLHRRLCRPEPRTMPHRWKR